MSFYMRVLRPHALDRAYLGIKGMVWQDRGFLIRLLVKACVMHRTQGVASPFVWLLLLSRNLG